jgi:hypothetical protein
VHEQKSKAYALLNEPFGLTLASTKAVASEANGVFVPPETRPTPFTNTKKAFGWKDLIAERSRFVTSFWKAG